MAYTFKHGERPLDDYTIQRAVGSGGFGEVYYAVSDGGREVALKYLKTNPEIELRGVSHCINLKSPHLVSIFDVKKNADGDYFIVMEYCSGPSLRDLLIAEPDGFGPQKAAFFVREIAKGLAYLHDRGIVHRDLKPGNIFFDDGYVKIGDYGLSKFISVSRHSAQTASVGTVHYMAPEIGSGNYSSGVDIYALGVMLYEMLCGKVPFEGSSMAEVLMKHLTAQPEVAELPYSFGTVIRKALEKDPKDRYQNVNEMVDELLDVEEVRNSVAGFSTQSLEGAYRRPAEEGPASPVPSPNPIPAHARNFGPPPLPGKRRYAPLPYAGGALPDRVAKRMERISRKLERKVARLGGAAGSRSPRPAHKRGDRRRRARPGTVPAPGTGGRGKRMFLTIVLGIGLAIGLGLLVAHANGVEEYGIAAGLSVVALCGSVLLSRKVAAWFGVLDGPTWAGRLIRMVTAAPLLAIGAAPLLDGRHTNPDGLGVWLGLLGVALLADWERVLDDPSRDDISFGSALRMAFGGMLAVAVATSLTGGDNENTLYLAGGVAGIASLVLQSAVWWRPSGATEGLAAKAIASGPGASEAPPSNASTVAGATLGLGSVPLAAPAPSAQGNDRNATDPEMRRRRWGTTRSFWGFAAFLTMGGAIATFVLTLVLNTDADTRTGLIIGCVACFAAMVFAIRKTTPMKAETFWRETFRPLLFSLALFGIGASTTGIARNWSALHRRPDDRAGLIVVLVFSGLLLVFSTFIRGRRRRSPEPFFRSEECDHGMHEHG